MLALHFFSREQSDQGVPLRKVHITCIKGSLARYINCERLKKSRLIVGDSIFSMEKKGVVQTWKRTCRGTIYVDITDQEII